MFDDHRRLMMDAIRKLVSTAVILANLPAKPGTNGAVLLIDDEEAARCVDEINAAILEFEALRKDAERYRKLEHDFSVMSPSMDGNHAWVYRRNFSLRGPTLAAAIDAA